MNSVNQDLLIKNNKVTYKLGEKIVSENESSRKLFIIEKGKVRVFKTYLGQKITLAVLGEGEIFGELSFVDGQPRSASVDALTDLELIVIDGAQGIEQVENLPHWVWTIFKTVFYRFRDLDQKIISLQSAFNYRKKGMKEDVLAATVHFELLRFIKALKMICNQVPTDKENIKLDEEDVLEELNSILGNRAIGLRPFWNQLKEFDFIDNEHLRKSNSVVLLADKIDAFEEHLKSEIEKQRYLVLSHTALLIIKKIVSNLLSMLNKPASNIETIPLNVEDLKLKSIPGYLEALKELNAVQIIKFEAGVFYVHPIETLNLYVNLSIVKCFDHAALYVD